MSKNNRAVRRAIKQHKVLRTPQYRKRVVEDDYKKRKEDQSVKEQYEEINKND